jgi:hypothetical protein
LLKKRIILKKLLQKRIILKKSPGLVVYMLQLALLSAELRKTMLQLNMTTSAVTTLPGKSE